MIEDIITERLILRKILERDAKEVFKIWCDNEKYMSDPVESIDEVRDICKRHRKEISSFLKVILLKDSKEIIGTCCFGNTSNNREWGFGYSIRKDKWGKGYATEIVQTIISVGRELGIENFISEAAIENKGSIKVLEKCGMAIDFKTSFRQPKSKVIYDSYVYKLYKSLKNGN